jgi:Family of unknown function (DUF6167)
VRRLFWMTVGATAGMVAMRKATRTVQALSPGGLGERLTTLGIALRVFGDEVRLGMAEREAELNSALARGVLPAAPRPPELAAGPQPAAGSGRHALRSGETGES